MLRMIIDIRKIVLRIIHCRTTGWSYVAMTQTVLRISWGDSGLARHATVRLPNSVVLVSTLVGSEAERPVELVQLGLVARASGRLRSQTHLNTEMIGCVGQILHRSTSPTLALKFIGHTDQLQFQMSVAGRRVDIEVDTWVSITQRIANGLHRLTLQPVRGSRLNLRQSHGVTHGVIVGLHQGWVKIRRWSALLSTKPVYLALDFMDASQRVILLVLARLQEITENPTSHGRMCALECTLLRGEPLQISPW